MATTGLMKEAETLAPDGRVTVGRSLYSLGERLFDRVPDLKARGLSAYLVSLEYEREACTEEESAEYERYVMEHAKEELGKGAYRSSWLAEKREAARARRAGTGHPWERYTTAYARKWEFLFLQQRSTYEAVLRDLRSKIRTMHTEEEAQFRLMDSTAAEAVFSSAASPGQSVPKICEYLFGKRGFNRDTALTGTEMLVFSKPLFRHWSSVVVVDKKALKGARPSGKSYVGDLEMSIGVVERSAGPRFLEAAGSYFLVSSAQLFPIALMPLGNVYKTFESRADLALFLGAHYQMYDIIGTELEAQMLAGLQEHFGK